MKKTLFLLLTMIFSIAAYSQNIQFKDKNFEKALIEGNDKNHDGVLSQEEVSEIRMIHFKNLNITSLDDISLFSNLNKLILEDIDLKDIYLKDIL